MLIFKIYKILSFEYSYSSKFNAIHYFDSKWDHSYQSKVAEIQRLLFFSLISVPFLGVSGFFWWAGGDVKSIVWPV